MEVPYTRLGGYFFACWNEKTRQGAGGLAADY